MDKKVRTFIKTTVLLLFCIILFTGCEEFFGSGSGPDLLGDLIKYDESGSIVSLNGEGDINTLAEEDSYTEASDDGAAAGGTEREVVEPDIYRISGDSLYLANSYQGLMVIDISDPTNPVLEGKLRITGTPYEMYFKGNNVILLSRNAGSWDKSLVTSIDVSDPGVMTENGTVELDGSFVDNRLVGDILYTVTNVYSYEQTVNSDGSLSSYSSTYTTEVTAVDTDTLIETDSIEIAGYSNAIHVTDTTLFTASSTGGWSEQSTLITSYDISDAAGTMTETGDYTVSGYIADRFKFDEYEGYLRAATYNWQDRTTLIYSIDWSDPASPVCRHDPVSLGEGETLYGTRFGDDFGYIVTFLQVDPLYVMDFSDPDAPEVKGELGEIPGWSEHIEIIGDKLFTVGIDNEDGWRVKVSYFDVSNPAAPAFLDDVLLGDENGYSYSGVLWDYKRLNYLADLDAWAVPFSWYDSDDYSYQHSVDLIKVNPATLEEYVMLPHSGAVKRTVNIESDTVFTCSDEEIRSFTVNGKDDYTLNEKLILAENVTGVFPLSEEMAVKRVSSGWGTETSLRTFSLDNWEETDFIGEIALGGNGYWGWYSSDANQFLSRGDHLYNLSNRYTSDGYGTWLTAYSFTDPALPVLASETKISDNYAYFGSSPENLLSSAFRPLGEDTYCVQSREEIIILDLSDPEAPDILDTITVEGINRFFIEDQICYVTSTEYPAGHWDYFRNFLSAWDLSDPESPSRLFKVNVPGEVLMRESDSVFVSYYTSYQKKAGRWDYWNPVHCLVSFSVEDETIEEIGILEIEDSIASYFTGDGFFAYFSGWGYGWDLYGTEDDAVARDAMYYPYGEMSRDLYTLHLSDALEPEVQKVDEYAPEDSWYSPRLLSYGDQLLITGQSALYLFTIDEEGGLVLESETQRDAPADYSAAACLIEGDLYEAEGFSGIVKTSLP